MTKVAIGCILPTVTKEAPAIQADKTVTAKVKPDLMAALDAFIAQESARGLSVKRSQALVAFARVGAGLTEEQPRKARRRAG